MDLQRATVDVHILQSVPPSCLNRDDTNSPKTAMYGGARRARVSSQAWKRATRMYFNNHLPADQQGVRTRRLPRLLKDEVLARLKQSNSPVDEARLDELIKKSIVLLGVKQKAAPKNKAASGLEDLAYTVFVSGSTIETIIGHLVDTYASGGELDAQHLQNAMRGRHALDIALFGRMIADTPDLNVDATCQVAHAISTHRVASEFDFFTAVDDLPIEEDTGSAMMGYIEFNSATLYRFASVSLGGLGKNLGGPDLVPAAVSGFVEAFSLSMPTGHQNTYAALTRPNLVFVSVRTDQPMSLVGAFEKAVTSSEGYVEESARKLAEHSAKLEGQYGPRVTGWLSCPGASKDVVASFGEPRKFQELCSTLGEYLNEWQTS